MVIIYNHFHCILIVDKPYNDIQGRCMQRLYIAHFRIIARVLRQIYLHAIKRSFTGNIGIAHWVRASRTNDWTGSDNIDPASIEQISEIICMSLKMR